jgi:hypothetical protein
MVASAVNLTGATSATKKPKPIRPEEWQAIAWGWYDTIGEYRYSCNWVGNLLSRAKLYVAQKGKNKPVTSGPAFDLLQDLFGGPEGQSEMLRQLGIHFTVAGENYLVGIPGANDNDPDDWRVVAATQLSFEAGVYKIGKKAIIGKPLIIRMWKPHPERGDQADSPSRAVLPTLAEIDGLAKRIAAEIDSRLAGAGILAVPSEMTMGVGPAAAVEGENAQPKTGADAFMETLQKAMTTAIGNREDASALVPIVIQAPGEFLDKITHIKFWSDLDANSIPLRNEAIRRLALGMDMPPEALEGSGDMNHWSAWQMDEASVKSHTEPLLEVITNALTTGYLQSALRAENVTNWHEFTIEADTAKMRLRPNRSKEAQELYDRGQLSAEAMLRENGFDPQDAMTDKERVAWFVQKVASGSTTPDLVAEALRLLGVKIENPPDAAVPQQTQPDTQEARPTPSLLGHPSRDLPDSEAAAAEAVVFRALERVGNRIKNRKGFVMPDGVEAIDLYQSVTVPTADLDDLLEGAWSICERIDFGVQSDHLVQSLDSYARALIATRKPHNRELMVSYLTVREPA